MELVTLLDTLQSAKVKAKTVNYVKLNKKVGEVYSFSLKLKDVLQNKLSCF